MAGKPKSTKPRKSWKPITFYELAAVNVIQMFYGHEDCNIYTKREIKSMAMALKQFDERRG